MKKEHTTKNPLKKLSLQWRLTLIITLLMTVTCVLMYFFISNSAVTGIENLGDYVVKINETDSTPITFNINPNTLFAGLSDQVQETKDLFRTRSIIATAMRYFRLTYQPAMQSFKSYIPACYANNPVKISIFRYADLSVLYYFNNQSNNVSTISLRN